MLFIPDLRKDALGCAAATFLVFGVVQTITYSRGLNISCGCFGSHEDNPIGPWSIFFVSVCFVAATATWFQTKRAGNSANLEVQAN